MLGTTYICKNPVSKCTRTNWLLLWCSAQLDEADTEAVDALMGMTGLLYAH